MYDLSQGPTNHQILHLLGVGKPFQPEMVFRHLADCSEAKALGPWVSCRGFENDSETDMVQSC